MQKVDDVIAKYTAIAGDYADNVYAGVEHYMLDSGICTDALSVQDAERIAAAGLYEGGEDSFVNNNGLDEINEAVKTADGGTDLDCIQCLQELDEAGFEFA